MPLTRAQRATALLFVIALGLGAAALAVELALRAVGLVVLVPQMYVIDPHTLYRYKPKVSEHFYWRGRFDWRWTTNSRGFRGASEYAVPKPAGVRRVLAIGDSFTFGYGVNDDQAYPHLLERRLAAACPGSRVEVINSGVGGWGQSQQLEFLDQEGLALAPDVVVQGFFTNDPADNAAQGVHRVEGDSLVTTPADARARTFGRSKRVVDALPGYAWLLRHSVIVNLLRQAYVRRGATAAGAADGGHGGSDPRIEKDLTPDQQRLMELLVSRTQARVDAAGSRLVLVLFPDRDELRKYAAGTPDSAETLAPMRAVCARLALRCVDVAEWLVRRAVGDDVSAFIDRAYIRGDSHFTPLGNALAAQAVAPEVARLLACGPEAADLD